MERDLADAERMLAEARRVHRRLVAAEARLAELEAERRRAVAAAIRAGATQIDVARALGLHHSTVRHILHGTGRRKRS